MPGRRGVGSGGDASDPAWTAVDDYIEHHLIARDPVLDAVLAANAAAGLQPMDVSAAQGKFLHLLARSMGAKRILEIGTLGGYSTLWLARALPADGRLITLEIDRHAAEVARANLATAGVAGLVELRLGPAVESLAALKDEGAAFDLIFVDADKQSNVAYLEAAISLSRTGTVLLFDNVVREGQVLDARHPDPRVHGTRALFEALQTDARVDATALQTVGSKKWDGFVMAVVNTIHSP